MPDYRYLDAPAIRGSELYAEVARITAGQNDVLAQGIMEAGRGVARGMEARAEGRQRERMLTMQQQGAMELMRAKQQAEAEEGAYLADAMGTIFQEAVPNAEPSLVEAVRTATRRNPEVGRFMAGKLIDSAQNEAKAQQEAMRVQAMQAGAQAGRQDLAAAVKGKYLDEDEQAVWESRIATAETPAQLNGVLGELGRRTLKAKEEAGIAERRARDLDKLRKGADDIIDSELRQAVSARIETLEGSSAAPAEWSRQYDAIVREMKGITTLPGGLGTEVNPPATRSGEIRDWLGRERTPGAPDAPTGAVERALGEKVRAGRDAQFERDLALAPPAAGQRGYVDLAAPEQERLIAFLTEFDGTPEEFDLALSALGVDIETVPPEVRARIREARVKPAEKPRSLEKVEEDKRGGLLFVPTKPLPARTKVWSGETRSPL